MVHRPPPWGGPPAQQGPVAGPIISEEPWARRLAQARAHVAVVLVHAKGDHEVIWPHDRRRARYRHPKTVYEIDLALHHTTITADLPSSGDAFSFKATVNVQWRVLDPSAVARHRVSSVKAALSPDLLLRLRRIARNFDITQSAAAEDEMNTRLGSPGINVTDHGQFAQAMKDAIERDCLGAEYGLWTRAIVELVLDEATIEHHTKMRQLNRAIQEEEATQALRLLREEHEQRITADRIIIYRDIIAAGDIERFALQLANHPGDIKAIDAIIREEQESSRRDTIDFVSHMVDSGVIERWEVSDQAREALDWLKAATARVIRERDERKQIEPEYRQQRRGRDTPGQGNGSAPSGEPPPAVVEAQVTDITPKPGGGDNAGSGGG